MCFVITFIVHIIIFLRKEFLENVFRIQRIETSDYLNLKNK